MTGILCEDKDWSDITDRPTSNFFQLFGDLYMLNSLDVRYIERHSGSANFGEKLVVVYEGDNLLLIPYLGFRRVKADDGLRLSDVYAMISKDVVVGSNNGDITAVLDGAAKVFDAIKNNPPVTQIECEYNIISIPQNFVPSNYIQSSCSRLT